MSIDQAIKAIERNNAACAAECAATKANSNLSEVGRHNELAKIYEAASNRHHELHKAMRAAIDGEKTALVKALLAGGRAGDEMSERDSMARAKAAKAKDPKALLALLKEASIMADTIQVRSCCYVAALDNLWSILEEAAAEGFKPAGTLLAYEQTYGARMSGDAFLGFKMRTTAPTRPSGL